MEEREKAYAYWLNSAPGIGMKAIGKLEECCTGVEEIYREGERLFKRVLSEKQARELIEFSFKWDVEGEYEALKETGVNFTTVHGTEYPDSLREIPDPPYGLFWKGALPEKNRMSVAVIGARDCTEYGSYVAKELGGTLGRYGIQVVSGMARGIDGISQQAALDAGGSSFAVLGCGVDICYPARSRMLYDKLLEQGGILSSYPPGTSPQPNLFPPRNRIVSGLSDAVVVVEARQRSGTLITVDMALEQGREVYTVPGRLTDRLSDGCNRLLKQGAGILLSPKEFIAELCALFPHKLPHLPHSLPVSEKQGAVLEGMEAGIFPWGVMSEEEQKVWSGLDFYPQSIEQIREKLGGGLSYPQALQILMRLCLKGAAQQAGPGYFQKKVP